MKKKFSIDRIEDGVAVCYDEACQKYEFSAELLNLARTALFEATLVDGNPTDIVYLEQETLTKKQTTKKRLDALFDRNK